MARILPALLSFGSFLLLSAGSSAAMQQAASEETIQFFKLNCSSCHTIGGGDLTGPDLKGLLERQERPWLTDFLRDPKGVLDRGDDYGRKLLSDANGVYMPPAPGMTEELAGKLLDLIEIESGLEKSRFAGIQLSERPLTQVDIDTGRELFMGARSFEAGVPACVVCHTVGSVGALGGGQLGPDLTAVYTRLEGRKALGAWLASPPSLTMQPIYQEVPLESDEILALVAFFEESNKGQEADASRQRLNFVLLGIGLAALFMVLLDLLWRRRFRTVRRSLVARS